MAWVLLTASPAGAGPAPAHTAAGSMEDFGACGSVLDPGCTTETLTVQASDVAEAYGGAVWASTSGLVVHIAFTCVVVETVEGGHWLYASGAGSDGLGYFVTLWDPDAALSGYRTTTAASTGPCGAPRVDPALLWGLAGDYEIQP